MEKRAVKRKRVGRPRTGKRPVIAMRIHPDLYEKIAQSADNRKIPIAEDAANRLQQSFQWDQTVEGIKQLKADTLRLELQNNGYERVAINEGFIWAEPGVNIWRMSVAVDAAAVGQAMASDPEFAQVLKRAIDKVKPQGDAT